MNEFQVIGEAGSLSLRRVVAVGRYESAPIRRAVRQARKDGRLIDLTYGRACRWVYFLDSGQIVLGTQSPSIDVDQEVQE